MEKIELRELRRAARRLLRDDEALISDLALISQGQRIKYFVDFSEIYHYTFIAKEKLASYIRYKEKSIRSIAFEELILSELFFRNKNEILLFPSHRVELSMLVDGISDAEVAEFGSALIELDGVSTSLTNDLKKILFNFRSLTQTLIFA